MLRLLGLDIGTTTLSAVVIDGESGEVLASVTELNNSAVSSQNTENKLQDPNIILKKIINIRDELVKKFSPISAIGVTGQMHGMLYLDEDGNAVSPLYTWQDESGNLNYKNTTYSKYISEKIGSNVASGYGIVTDFVCKDKGKKPFNATTFCTIQDYIVMSLIKSATPLMHSSNAASFGCYDLVNNDFNSDGLSKIGIDRCSLPKVLKSAKIAGKDKYGIPVAIAVGDNQASVIGSVIGDNGVLINIGTGSQISLISKYDYTASDIEFRPLYDDLFLRVGAPLCGGRSYAILRNFFKKCFELFDCDINADIYKIMDEIARKNIKNTDLKVDTRFCGTRENPDLCGSISSVSDNNFTPQALIVGFIRGMVEELYSLYKKLNQNNYKPSFLVGSGNAIRKGDVLRTVIENEFNLSLKMPIHSEEAAFGAAIFAAVANGDYKDISEAQKTLIHYL